MTKLKYILLTLGLLACFISQAQASSLMPTDPGKPIMITQGTQEFSVNLASNPTTGYSWFAEDYSPQFIQVVKHDYQPPKEMIPGAGGMDTWTFKLLPTALAAPHVLKIRLLYARPWDIKDNAKEVEFIVVTN